MSVTEPSADPVQPEGQGGEGTGGNPLYADYLARIPEEARGAAEEAFKAWDADVTRKFSEASDFRKAWEPYEPLGLNQLPPEEVQWALEFRQAALENPQAVKEWFDEYARNNGLTEEQKAAVAEQTPGLEEFGFGDPQQLEKLLSDKLSPLEQQLQKFTEWQEQQEFSQRKAEAERYIEGQIAELKQKHPDDFKDEGPYGAEKMVERLISSYIDADPLHAVERAFADYQALTAQIEKATLQSKATQPPPAETGGTVNGAPEEIKTMADANRVALERIRQARQP